MEKFDQAYAEELLETEKYEELFAYAEKFSANRDPAAMRMLSECYFYGYGTEKNRYIAAHYRLTSEHPEWNRLPEDLEVFELLPPKADMDSLEKPGSILFLPESARKLLGIWEKSQTDAGEPEKDSPETDA